MTIAQLNQYLEMQDVAVESEAEWEEENREALDIQMYGMTTESLERSKPEYQDNIGEAMSWLSDAQEVVFTYPEQARQMINRAKYFMLKAPRTYPPIR